MEIKQYSDVIIKEDAIKIIHNTWRGDVAPSLVDVVFQVTHCYDNGIVDLSSKSINAHDVYLNDGNKCKLYDESECIIRNIPISSLQKI